MKTTSKMKATKKMNKTLKMMMTSKLKVTLNKNLSPPPTLKNILPEFFFNDFSTWQPHHN